ncbi:hypothetical protein [Daejeonella rubra]|nr:hypothetical protein [Daejeonella rubra]
MINRQYRSVINDLPDLQTEDFTQLPDGISPKQALLIKGSCMQKKRA